MCCSINLNGINTALVACKGRNPNAMLWWMAAPRLPDQSLKVMNSALASSLRIRSRFIYQGKVSCTHSLFTKKISTFEWHNPKGGTLKPLPTAAGKGQSQETSRNISPGSAHSRWVRVRASLQPVQHMSEGPLAGLQQ